MVKKTHNNRLFILLIIIFFLSINFYFSFNNENSNYEYRSNNTINAMVANENDDLKPIWLKILDGSRNDISSSIINNSKNYFICGTTESYGAGNKDIWVIETDNLGNEIWNRTYGGKNNDSGISIQKISDNDYLIIGNTESYGSGLSNIWLINIDANGIEKWNRTIGSVNAEFINSVSRTGDIGFVLVGSIFYGHSIWSDVYVVNIDNSGNELWNASYGGILEDTAISIKQTSDKGYVIIGNTQSFGRGRSDIWMIKINETGVEKWNKTFGGEEYEVGYDIMKSSDGNFIIAGNKESFNAEDTSIILIKIDESGEEIWNYTYENKNSQWSFSIVKTHDNGYILAGYEASDSITRSNMLLMKVDINGTKQWTRSYNFSSLESCYTILPITDNNFLISGWVTSDFNGNSDIIIFEIDSEGAGGQNSKKPTCNLMSYYSEDEGIITFNGKALGKDRRIEKVIGRIDNGKEFKSTGTTNWTIKINTNELGHGRQILFIRSFDGKLFSDYIEYELIIDKEIKEFKQPRLSWWKVFEGYSYGSIEISDDNNYVILGNYFNETPETSDDDLLFNVDMQVIKINSNGEQKWIKRYDHTIVDSGHSIHRTFDGGYILIGNTGEFWNYANDILVIKIDEEGDEQWRRTYGTSGDYVDDLAASITQTSDGGYFITGTSPNSGIDIITLIKTNAIGEIEWEKRYFDDLNLRGEQGIQTQDGNYIVIGDIYKWMDEEDGIIVFKLDQSGELIWKKIYGGPGNEAPDTIQQTIDGNFIISGRINSRQNEVFDLYLMKIDVNGNKLWDRKFGGNNFEMPYDVKQTSDRGFLIVGQTSSFGLEGKDSSGYKTHNLWLLRTDRLGNLQWDFTFGGRASEYGSSIILTNDNGFMVSGTTSSFGDENSSLVLLKFESINFVEINNSKPTCIITVPRNNDNVKGTIQIVGSASDSDGEVETVELKIENGDWQKAVGTYNWYFDLDTTLYDEGHYRFYVRSFDGELFSDYLNNSVVIYIENNDEGINDGENNENGNYSNEYYTFLWITFWINSGLIILLVTIIIFLLKVQKVKNK